MKLILRQKGRRRMGFPVSYPLRDCDGVQVFGDRRQLKDRRKLAYGIDDMRTMLSKMSSE
jgi:hypothetical protein